MLSIGVFFSKLLIGVLLLSNEKIEITPHIQHVKLNKLLTLLSLNFNLFVNGLSFGKKFLLNFSINDKCFSANDVTDNNRIKGAKKLYDLTLISLEFFLIFSGIDV